MVFELTSSSVLEEDGLLGGVTLWSGMDMDISILSCPLGAESAAGSCPEAGRRLNVSTDARRTTAIARQGRRGVQAIGDSSDGVSFFLTMPGRMRHLKYGNIQPRMVFRILEAGQCRLQVWRTAS